jgi:DNA-binding NarL/FixJ family response regulator
VFLMKHEIDNTAIRILLIEDKPADILLIKRMLSTVVNFTIEQVARLTAGLERLAKGGIDVILMDIVLPDGEGILSIKEICAMFPGVPLVVLTGFPDEEMGVRAIHEGAQDYLVKGLINADALRRILRYSIERKRIREELTEYHYLQSQKAISGKIALESKELLIVLLQKIVLSKKHVPSDSEAYKALSDAENACKKARELNNQLLDALKRQE